MYVFQTRATATERSLFEVELYAPVQLLDTFYDQLPSARAGNFRKFHSVLSRFEATSLLHRFNLGEALASFSAALQPLRVWLHFLAITALRQTCGWGLREDAIQGPPAAGSPRFARRHNRCTPHRGVLKPVLKSPWSQPGETSTSFFSGVSVCLCSTYRRLISRVPSRAAALSELTGKHGISTHDVSGGNDRTDEAEWHQADVLGDEQTPRWRALSERAEHSKSGEDKACLDVNALAAEQTIQQLIRLNRWDLANVQTNDLRETLPL